LSDKRTTVFCSDFIAAHWPEFSPNTDADADARLSDGPTASKACSAVIAIFTLEQAAHAGFTKKAEEAARTLAQEAGNQLGKAPTHSCVEGRTLLFVLVSCFAASVLEIQRLTRRRKTSRPKSADRLTPPLYLRSASRFALEPVFGWFSAPYLLACCTDHNWSVKLDNFQSLSYSTELVGDWQCFLRVC
jgi:hypothetical protein